MRKKIGMLQIAISEDDEVVREMEEQLEDSRAEYAATREQLQVTEASLRAKEE